MRRAAANAFDVEEIRLYANGRLPPGAAKAPQCAQEFVSVIGQKRSIYQILKSAERAGFEP